MGRAVDHVADHPGGQGALVDLDPADRTVNRPQHVIVNDQRLERTGQDAGQHSGRLVDQVGPGVGGQGHGQTLLMAGLVVGRLRVGHTGRHPGRQA